jgi:hypothetical protein
VPDRIIRRLSLDNRERRLWFHYITGQLALAFGLQDELLDIWCGISFRSWAKSSDLNINADVLYTAYAFADLVGERPESGYVFTDVLGERPKSLPTECLRA